MYVISEGRNVYLANIETEIDNDTIYFINPILYFIQRRDRSVLG